MASPSKTVLVIASNEDDRVIWSAVLEHYGYVAALADSLATIPTAIRADLVLVALDRFDPPRARLLREVIQDRRIGGVPVVGVIDPDVHPAKPLQAGCAGVLTRPLRPAALEAEVRRLIGPATPSG